MSVLIKHYPNRFDPFYLGILKAHLSVDSLKKTALYKPVTINDITYNYCINIDFCGLAATTLFFADMARSEINAENFEKRREVSLAFKKLFDGDVLQQLNEEGFYLRARFCFSYLYSDFPICLMKAEQKEMWNNLAEQPLYDFYISKPLNRFEFESTNIFESQQHSLGEIAKILKQNPNIVFLGGEEKKVNTMQVRFSVIPSTICTLLINNTAFCDPYLYSKLEADGELSLSYPVLIIPDDSSSAAAFQSVRRHFHYLWRHDLTLYSKDATSFDYDNPEGLKSVLSPNLVVGPKGTNWAHKEKRIRDKKEEVSGDVIKQTKEENNKVDLWKWNLNKKLIVCTRKIKRVLNESVPNVNLVVGMKKKFYYFKIEIFDQQLLFEFLQPEETVLYCALAHYSYARLNGIKPNLHEFLANNNYTNSKLASMISRQLNHNDLNKTSQLDDQGAGRYCFNQLFLHDSGFELKIDNDSIDFDQDNFFLIEKAKFSTIYLKNNKKHFRKSCLDFSSGKGD